MIKISIIIVNYKVKKELFGCLESIISIKSKVSYEIVVVDNDADEKIRTAIKKRFPQVKYISNENKGFGEGNNVGAKYANGEYLFFLNPDTKIFPHTLDELIKFFDKNKKVGIVAPVLLGEDEKPYPQGTEKLTPLSGIFALSFINKLFPHNPISKRYWLEDWDRNSLKEVDTAPGTAFMIRKKLFEGIGGFDENFFLYFEEFDLCKRVKDLGWKIFIIPSAKVYHHWGASTKKSSQNIQKIFIQSRFYYFKKHFGLLSALFTEAVLRIGKTSVFLAAILFLGLFLRLYNIGASMPFIGDQGWFYISARDMVLGGDVPLVGIASSHPWLHQGAFWTYMLAGGFWIFGFNPFVGAFISILSGLLAVLGMYKLGVVMFSRRVGLLAAGLFATSPLIIASDRMPYHTSPIPLFSILFIYCLYRWVSGNLRFFPLVIACLAILYNFELAAALFGMITMVVWLYGLVKKKKWALGIFSPKSLFLGLIAFTVPMLPMIIYDFGHGFPQTLGFVAWLGYKVLVMFGYPPLHPTTPASWMEMLNFFGEFIRRLLFGFNVFVAVGIFGVSLVILFRKLLDFRVQKNSIRAGMIIILAVNFILIVGLFAVRTPSEAYLPMMFPGLVLMVALIFDRLLSSEGIRRIGLLGLIAIILFNVFYSFRQSASGNYFKKQWEISKYIVKEASGKEYNLIGRGEGSQFESFTMNYEYLTWWFGQAPSKKGQKLRFLMEEKNGEIRVGEQHL